MPRQRKSPDALALKGAYDHNPKRTRKDVTGAGVIGPWRDHSSDPAAIWAELVAEVPPGLLCAADRKSLELAVALIAAMRRDPASFPTGKASLLVSILVKLGCMPAARVAMELPTPKGDHDPQEKYFAR